LFAWRWERSRGAMGMSMVHGPKKNGRTKKLEPKNQESKVGVGWRGGNLTRRTFL
jgi:hypothetical protein